MTRKEVFLKYKNIQKRLAKRISENKEIRKEKQRKNPYLVSHWEIEYNLIELKKEFRNRHIAICLLRGKTYEQIENKCAENNEPNFELIEEIKNEILEQIENKVEESTVAA